MSGEDTCFSHYEHLGESHHQFHNMFCTIGTSQKVLSFFIPNSKNNIFFDMGLFFMKLAFAPIAHPGRAFGLAITFDCLITKNP